MVQASRRELHLAARQRGNERRARREALADAERERQKALRSRYSVATAKRESSPRATGRETVLGPDGSIVAVDVVGFSLRKAEDHQRHAAERIAQDHELATSGLRSNGFEYQSRGTRTDMSHLRRAAAAERLRDVLAYIGADKTLVLLCVIGGMSPAEVAEQTADKEPVVRWRLIGALNRAATFYEGRTYRTRAETRATVLLAQFPAVQTAMAAIEAAA